MKKQILTFALVLCATYGYSQNSNPWPTTGNVGIGTTTPTVKLDILESTSLVSKDLAFVGSRGSTNSAGVYFQSIQHLNSSLGANGRGFRLRSVEDNINAGFIEFNKPLTPNTTKAAVAFGHNSVELMRINQDGKVRIGNGPNDIKTPDGYKLFVEEGILAEKVKVAVKTTANWADYVFAEDYKLMPLTEVEEFTKNNKHLPNVPSAKQMVENGLDVAQMDAKLMEKVEELTLYLIEQNKQIELLKTEITALKNQK
jgi:hypothetical protein